MLVYPPEVPGNRREPSVSGRVLCDVSGAFLASVEFISSQAHRRRDRPGPVVRLGRNSLTRCPPLRLPKDNSHWKTSFCLWHSLKCQGSVWEGV